MFGIGSTELLIILVVALVIIGPKKLPDVMRTIGKGMAEFRRVSTDVKTTLEAEVDKAEQESRKKDEAERAKAEAARKKPEEAKTVEAEAKAEPEVAASEEAEKETAKAETDASSAA